MQGFTYQPSDVLRVSSLMLVTHSGFWTLRMKVMLGIQKFRTCCSRLLMVVPHIFFAQDGLRGSVFDGPSLPMLGLDLEGASVDVFQ